MLNMYITACVSDKRVLGSIGIRNDTGVIEMVKFIYISLIVFGRD